MVNDSGPTPRPIANAEALYQRHLPRLIGIAAAKFHLAEEEVWDIAHEVFLRLVVAEHRLHDEAGWLAVVLFNACRTHLSVAQRHEELLPAPGPRTTDPRPHLENRVLLAQIAEELDARSIDMLRLHFLEGYTAPEIARMRNTTSDYVHKLVHQALAAARGACVRKDVAP